MTTASSPLLPARRSFASIWASFAVRPRASAADLARDPRVVRLGFAALLVQIVGYTIVYAGLSRSGAYPSRFTPWLAIPAEDYYRWNLLLLAPSMVAAWLLAAAVVQVLARAVGGCATFEATAGVLGFAISIAGMTLLPHDLVVGVLGGLHVVDGRAHEHAMNVPGPARTILWILFAAYGIAFATMFTKTLGGAHRLAGARALGVGLVGFAVYQLVFLVFNR